MRTAAALLVLACCAGCAGDNTAFLNNYSGPPPSPPPPVLLGEPAQYVCLRNAAIGCIRGEWRCPSPLQMRAGEDGQPRCVMPGRDY